MSKAKSHFVDGSYQRDKINLSGCHHLLALASTAWKKGDFLKSMKMGMAGTSENEVLEKQDHWRGLLEVRRFTLLIIKIEDRFLDFSTFKTMVLKLGFVRISG